MAAMKPRTGDGPLEVTKEGRGIVLRMPLEGGGRLVVEMTPDEAKDLGRVINETEPASLHSGREFLGVDIVAGTAHRYQVDCHEVITDGHRAPF